NARRALERRGCAVAPRQPRRCASAASDARSTVRRADGQAERPAGQRRGSGGGRHDQRLAGRRVTEGRCPEGVDRQPEPARSQHEGAAGRDRSAEGDGVNWSMSDENKAVEPSAPATGANPAATPQHKPVPGGDAPATAAAAAATGAKPTTPAPAAPGAHAVKPAAAPRPAPAPIPDLAGKTTNVASPGGAAARAVPAVPAAKAAIR